mmetsp:Transcript_22556/g.31405  ORF Transcript_22556/g.31405 Transcript_22556/m.31405 type:complete len:142 (+) Transcript_22556:144-569(+)|eukprot:CAMPEP_0196589104 /NCGR_PEP_ID=MMETSP1081-20130531/62724_1 /TAXON_ID=36882 /ORGANISM="Pyramimonas amylifera, Strain CCMP720" /LENGTH=141 /DNA_ID=CAMNT_0041911821 /DNA_START=136 /DNA_END=561 /DNA_ORIENTATION=-
MSSYQKVVGGKLSLKGGISLKSDIKKKSKKKKKNKSEAALNPVETEEEAGTVVEEGVASKKESEEEMLATTDITAPGKGYEQLFPYETQRALESKGRSVCFGTNYRAAPEILHGYTSKVKGVTPEERLDMRCGQKADKHCK